MSDELLKRLRDPDEMTCADGMEAADRIEALTEKLAKAVEALLLARVHVANNEQGWSVGRASARSDLKIINALLAEIEGSDAP
jgi:hypothetical protein